MVIGNVLSRRIIISSNYSLSLSAFFKRAGNIRSRSFCKQQHHGEVKPLNYRELIAQHTEVTTNHLTPEIQLHLITPNCPMWHQGTGECIFNEPYWAFYWPGGQVLTRYLLDNGGVVKDKVVVDIGSGCGASAIAAAKVGAKHVLANDIDPVAIHAIQMNAELNKLNQNLRTSTENLIGQIHEWDILLLGDMFYDSDISDSVLGWLEMVSRHKTRIFVGDPCRVYMLDHPVRKKLRLLADYELPEECREENYGLSSGFVWEFIS